jgi:hypothetical protein
MVPDIINKPFHGECIVNSGGIAEFEITDVCMTNEPNDETIAIIALSIDDWARFIYSAKVNKIESSPISAPFLSQILV